MTNDGAGRKDLVDSRVSWVLWGIPIGLGMLAAYWPTMRSVLLVVAFSWAGLACVVNARRCGRFHCHLTGPLYLGLAAVSALIGLGAVDLAWRWVAIIFALGTAIAYLPEFVGWQYIRSDAKNRVT